MSILNKLFNNTAYPEGIMGGLMVICMNIGHSKVADWGIKFIEGGDFKRIAEIGCGGGRNVKILLKKFPGAKITAIDPSPVSVKRTKKTNKKYIKNGRCMVLKGNAEKMPINSESCDLATAFETVYFWPGPDESFKEVYRILKPKGIFMIVNEAAGYGRYDRKWEKMISGLRIYSEKQLTEKLKKAGFRQMISHTDIEKNRICILARK